MCTVIGKEFILFLGNATNAEPDENKKRTENGVSSIESSILFFTYERPLQ